MIISVKSAVIASMAITSSNAFAPSSSVRNCAGVGSLCSLHLHAAREEIDVNRRQVVQQTLAVVASTLFMPLMANADAEVIAKPATPVAATPAPTTSAPVVEKKEVLTASAGKVTSSQTEVAKPEASASFKSTPAYEKVVTADASVSSSTTTVSSSAAPVKEKVATPVKEKEVVAVTQAPPGGTLSAPPPPKPLTEESYALSIQQSTSALSTQLGHAFLVVDGLNSQARRLAASSHPAHGIAVLEGMNTQARRLQDDLTGASALYKTIITQAKQITVPEEGFETTVAGVTRASSVLDGVIAQSKRLVAASSVAGGTTLDDQIVYMLSVLDGLNTQVKRLNVKDTFGMLDKLNSQAEKMV